MKKFSLLLWVLLLNQPFLFGQSGQLEMRIYLIGDAGEMKDGQHPVILDLEKRLPMDTATITHLIYLGDNIYPKGMPLRDDLEREKAEELLNTQLGFYNKLNGRIWMVPGNHDWERGLKKGLEAVVRAENYVKANFPREKVSWIPSKGCPGPEVIELDSERLLVVFDSQWWLHKHAKPGIDSACASRTDQELLSNIQEIFDQNRDKTMLFAMHHPMRSYGPHNGGYGWKDHIFPLTALSPAIYLPLPVIGSIYPLYRTWFGNIQDIPHPRYQSMIHSLDSIFATHPKVIQIAGHEHGLFYTEENSNHYVVSGAGAKNTHFKKKSAASFSYGHTGYAYLDFYSDGTVFINFLTPDQRSPLYTNKLTFSSKNLN